MLPDETKTDLFTEFVLDVEAKLRRMRSVASEGYGTAIGSNDEHIVGLEVYDSVRRLLQRINRYLVVGEPLNQ